MADSWIAIITVVVVCVGAVILVAWLPCWLSRRAWDRYEREASEEWRRKYMERK